MSIDQYEKLFNHQIFLSFDIHDMPWCRIHSEWILADFYCLLRDGAFLVDYEEKIKVFLCFKFVVGLCFSCFHWYGNQFISTTYDCWMYYVAGKLGANSVSS